jgi:hypothetical protein
MLTAAVRDMHRCYPGRFVTDVRTPCPAIWTNNPYIVPLEEKEPNTRIIDCEYPLVHCSNQQPLHFLNGFVDFLNESLGLRIVITEFNGDIHISQEEREQMSQVMEITGEDTPYWIIVSGGKWDYTAKWWSVERLQKVVDTFRRKILFVQVGEQGHFHPKTHGTIDLRGKTDLRQLIRLVYHAQGVICPVTALMHLAAAVPVRPERFDPRPCIVLAGGREPPHWEAYPSHHYIHRIGLLRCCATGGCWKSRVEPLGDGDAKDEPVSVCEKPVTQNFDRERLSDNFGGLMPNGVRYLGPKSLPACMDSITSHEVIEKIKMYFRLSDEKYLSRASVRAVATTVSEINWADVSS